jgi:hypothetical protein
MSEVCRGDHGDFGSLRFNGFVSRRCRVGGVFASHGRVLVAARERGQLTPGRPKPREMLADPYREKLEEWVDHSRGKVRADVAHEKLIALGYTGSERTTRRAVAEAKTAYLAGRRRVHRPWVPEPGMWFQYDFGDGPRVNGVGTQLFCAWLAWCRFRVVLALLDKTLPSVMAAIDQTLRMFCGVPTFGLTDNEKTVTMLTLIEIDQCCSLKVTTLAPCSG